MVIKIEGNIIHETYGGSTDSYRLNPDGTVHSWYFGNHGSGDETSNGHDIPMNQVPQHIREAAGWEEKENQ